MKLIFNYIFLLFIFCVKFSIAQIRPYLHGNVGFIHLITPSDTFKTKNSPNYTLGLGGTIRNFGCELNVYQSKYKSNSFNYQYVTPDLHYSVETYKQVFTRRGIDVTVYYHRSLSSKFVLWCKAGVSYYQFKPSIETKDNNVRDEIQSFETYWKQYNKFLPIGTLRLSYSPIRYTNIYIEGGYDLTMFKAGVLIGNVGKAHSTKKKQENNAAYAKPTTASSQPNQTTKTDNNNTKLKFRKGKFKGIEWEPINITNNQIYSTFLVATNLNKKIKVNGAENRLGFKINSNQKDIVLKWEIECSNKTLLNTQTGFINYNDIKDIGTFKPNILWNYTELKKMSSSSNIVITYRLIDPNTGNKVEKTQSILVKYFNEWLVSEDIRNYQSMFTILVNEKNSEVEKISRKVLDTKMVDAIRGYKKGTTDVSLQVASVWRVLNEMDFEFKQPIINSLENLVKNTSVKSIDKVIKAKTGNTIEGAILFSSILKKMGIHSALIFMSDKCYLGYYTDEKTNSAINILDLTLISNNTFISNPKQSVQDNKAELADIPKALKLSDLNKAYYLEYLNAISEGNKAYQEIKNKSDVNQLNILDIDSLKKEFETFKME